MGPFLQLIQLVFWRGDFWQSQTFTSKVVRAVPKQGC
jgi:hypothetical protein